MKVNDNKFDHCCHRMYQTIEMVQQVENDLCHLIFCAEQAVSNLKDLRDDLCDYRLELLDTIEIKEEE